MKGFRKFRKLGLVLVILIAGIFLTGCNNIVITAPDCCQQPIMIECNGNVTVISTSPDVYGEILANGEGTGEYFLPYQSYQARIISGMPCNEVLTIRIRDDCGYLSQEMKVLIVPGEDNEVVYTDWGPYGVKEQQKGQNDCQENNCHNHKD